MLLAIGGTVLQMAGNRYTDEDARVDLQQLLGNIQQLQRQIQQIHRELAETWKTIAGLPPDTFEAKFDKAVAEIQALRVELERLKK